MITCSHLLATVHNGGEGSRNLVLILEQMTVLPSQAPEPALEFARDIEEQNPDPTLGRGREEAGIKENPTATALKSQLLSSAARRRRWP